MKKSKIKKWVICLCILMMFSMTSSFFGCNSNDDKAFSNKINHEIDLEKTNANSKNNDVLINDEESEKKEYYENLEDELISDSEDDYEIERGSCPISENMNCYESLGKICGSDDRTYQDVCKACDNPNVEYWFEGEC